MTTIQERLHLLTEAFGAPFRGRLIGVEKESLRIDKDGYIATTPHPKELGSALTHDSITTDFSEALLEFITPPQSDGKSVIQCLADMHRYCYAHLDDEMLWVASMPCLLVADEDIPIAYYGRSNIGQMKSIYRRGLSLRYGRAMQIIAGVHFNFSLPEAVWQVLRQAQSSSYTDLEFRSHSYFGLIRNFQRIGWIVPYLFGSSPMVCQSFLRVRSADNVSDFQLPFATSLRMGNMGYKNDAQRALRIDYNTLDDYVTTLSVATEKPLAQFAALGEFAPNGERQQLNVNQLQIENEYYSVVRPKQMAHSGEKPSRALTQRGVRYVEVRALDLDPYSPTGISTTTVYFMEVLLIACALDDSPPITADEQRMINNNQRHIADQGRKPGLTLIRHGQPIALHDWLLDILQKLEAVAQVLDQENHDTRYSDVIVRQSQVVADPSWLPSSRVCVDTEVAHKGVFLDFALQQSQRHRQTFLADPLSASKHTLLDAEATASLKRQVDIERVDTIDFETYLAQYLAQRLTS